MSTLSSREFTTLVVVDAQERLCSAMENGAESIATAIARLVEAANLLGVGTIVTEQYPKGLGPTTQTVKEALSPVTPTIEKTSFSCWGADGFRFAVQAIRPRSLVLVGMETHVCVQQTALEALDEGYRVVVAADAVCSRNDLDRAMSLALMRERGVTVSTVEAVVFDWLRDARHAKFKDVVKLFK